MQKMEPPAFATPRARYEYGARLRKRTPLEAHADLHEPRGRNPVALLTAGDRTRVPELIPVRYERMLASPFAFLRGAAAVMAQDLKHQAGAGIAVQACGDCHLLNFGAFATPEENILFDINDFDETLPGVDFSVDLKRLTASVAVAALAAKLSKNGESSRQSSPRLSGTWKRMTIFRIWSKAAASPTAPL